MSADEKILDTIIIGAGIAGLYAAMQLTKDHRFILLEQGDHVGGRMGMMRFMRGVSVVTGAGVVRAYNDHMLLQLLADLDVPTRSYQKQFAYVDPPMNIKATWARLKRATVAQQHIVSGKTFKAFARKELGDKAYRNLVRTMGYSDFENAAALDTLRDYGVRDVIQHDEDTFLSVDWDMVLKKLVARIGGTRRRVQLRTSVEELTQNAEGTFTVRARVRTHAPKSRERQMTYVCKQVILAVSVPALRQLLPNHPEYRVIQGQPFLRVYAQFNAASAALMRASVPTYTVVSNDLQKIIPIRPDQGIYMVAYSDNQRARRVERGLARSKDPARWLAGRVEDALHMHPGSLQIVKWKPVSWELGTHYYAPGMGENDRDAFLRRAQHPLPGVIVVGEALSRQQGWIEGALQSVRKAGIKSSDI